MAMTTNDAEKTNCMPERKKIRLPNHDYSTPGAYFVTICTAGRRCILSKITVGAAISRPSNSGFAIHLTPCGEIVDLAIHNIPTFYPQVSVDNYVIMPNHVHLLLQIHSDEGGRMLSAPTVGDGGGETIIACPAGKSAWQKSFHEHVIRNENDYREIWEYIDNNPAKWLEDRYYMD